MNPTTEIDLSASEAGRRIARLTDRQRECLDQASRGMSSKEIAIQLGIAPSTVDNHIMTAMEKLEVGSRRQAVRLIDLVRRRNGPSAMPPNVERTAGTRRIPPLGGSENQTLAPRRLLQILTIGVLSILVVLALVLSIAGAVHVLEQ